MEPPRRTRGRARSGPGGLLIIDGMYQVRRQPRTEFVKVRNLNYHVRLWGDTSDTRPPLFMLHGWMDVGASWQFVVDALAQERFIIAPDWRGFGLTQVPPTDHYWFPDYLADLDLLLDHYAGERPIDLVGHSMGGNVSMMYAGVRPARLRRLVNLEGFGMAATRPAQAPGRYAKWIDSIKDFHSGDVALRDYDTLDGVARRLMKTNPRLPQDKALWLAAYWSGQQADGSWRILGDPAHKLPNPILSRQEEILALYERITAPTLFVRSGDDSLSGWHKRGEYTFEEFKERLGHVPQARLETVPDCGHMLHHDQPQAVAGLIENFLAENP